MIKKQNLFQDIPDDLPEEFVEHLIDGNEPFRIERIVSRGHDSPPDFWYCQDTSEWVLLVRGAATLVFADPDRSIDLSAGDWLNIPAGTKHRVERTSKTEDSVWLAIHSL